MKPHLIHCLPIVGALLAPLVHAGIGSAITADVTVDTRTPNQAPTANPTAVVTNAATRQVSLGANAGDIDGSIVSYAWTWPGGGSASGATPVVTLPYGSTTFSLTVTDDDGATASGSTSVTVSPLATVDSDGDGINDLAEYTLRARGYLCAPAVTIGTSRNLHLPQNSTPQACTTSPPCVPCKPPPLSSPAILPPEKSASPSASGSPST